MDCQFDPSPSHFSVSPGTDHLPAPPPPPRRLLSRRKSTSIITKMGRLLGIIGLLGLSGWLYLAQPLIGGVGGDIVNGSKLYQVNTARLKENVERLGLDFYPRNWSEAENLWRNSEFIAAQFRLAGAAEVEFQEFEAFGNRYRNVIARFPAGSPGGDEENAHWLIVGAHYDACCDSYGADDNSSAVAGLIELAYLLGKQSAEDSTENSTALADTAGSIARSVAGPKSQRSQRSQHRRPLELVAWCLEEPPAFATDNMGSVHYARSLAARAAEIEGVIVLEMIGYYTDEPASQRYPTPLMYALYPSVGNFIAVVSRSDQRGFIRRVKRGLIAGAGLGTGTGAERLPVYSLAAPAWVPGVDFSDHRSFWPVGIQSVMITDTAFYRNPHYHTTADLPETLDYRRMSQVVGAVYHALLNL